MPAQDSCLTVNRVRLLEEVNRRHVKRDLLAEEIGVTPRTLRRWLHGQTSRVQAVHLELLAQKLGCSFRDLVVEGEGSDEVPLIQDVHPVLRQLRYYVLQGAHPDNFESATQLVQGCGGELPFDTQAATLFEYARFAFQLGHIHQARRSFERAVMKADAAGCDAIRFQSFLSLARITGQDKDDSERSTMFLEQAEHVLIRMRAQHWRPFLWLMEARQAMLQGSLEKALTLTQNAMEILNLDASSHSLDTIESLDIVASVYQSMGSRRKAKEILSTADTIAQSILHKDHPMRGRLLVRQSAINGFLGAKELSVRQAQEGVRILDALLPIDSYDRTSAWNQLGAAYSDAGEFEKGIDAMERALGGNADMEPRLRTNFGLFLNRMGRSEEAALQGKKAVELFTATAGPNHHETAAAIGRYASAIESMGQVEVAEKLHAEAARLLEKTDPFHVRILDQVRNQANCLMLMGRHDEAAQILKFHRRIYTKRDESPLYQGRYSLLQAQAIAGDRQNREEALSFALDAKAKLQSPGIHAGKLLHETETLIGALRRAH